MRNITLAILLLAAIFIGGCDDSPSVVSLHPLYDERTLSFEPGLVASWTLATEGGHSETWTFEKSPAGSTYRLVITEVERERKTTEFEAAAVQLAGFLFMDLRSLYTGETGPPAHMFFRV